MKNKMLKFTSAVLAFSMTCLFLSTSVSASAASWYITRNGNKRPGFPEDAEELSKYGCYYIDNKLSDDSETKRIYLTFDAGYENGNVEKILDVLHEEGVPAAFFLLDNIILKNTDLVKRMTSEGHTVCNHTKSHKDLTKATTEFIEADLSALEEIYERETGEKMSKYFRFPEGKYSIDAVKCINELGYKTIFWSFGYDDWDNARQPSREYAIKKILDNTHNGAVILLHPTSSTNAEILPELISRWREMGYSFGTLDMLVAD